MSVLQGLRQRYRVSEDPLRTLRRIEMVALVLAVLLCLQLGFGAFDLGATTGPEPVQPAADSLQVPAVLGPVVVAAQERNEIVARPLFWSGRLPADMVAVEEVDKSDAKARELKDVKLVGVFGSGERLGIITLVKDKKRRILLGESLDGWTVKTIASSDVVLTNGERQETLSLQRGEVTVAAPPARAPDASVGRPIRQYAPPDAPENMAAEPAAETGKKGRRPAPGAGAEQGLRLGPQ